MVPRMSVVRRPSQGSPVSFKRRPRKKAAPSSEPCRICSARKATRLLPTPTRHRASRQKPLINYVKTHMVEFAAQRPQARFYVAKAIPVSELGKGHRQILIPTREASRSRISAVPSDTTAKLAIRQETQQLGEHRAALVQIGKSPSTDTDPNKRSLAVAHLRRTERHNGETRDPAGNSATGRTPCGPGS